MREQILKEFDSFILQTFKLKPEVRRYLIDHERKNICIDNLCREIQTIERRKLRIIFDLQAYKRTVRDVAKMFCEACLLHAEEKALTSNERSRRIREGQKEADAQEMINEWKREGSLIERSGVIGIGEARATKVEGEEV